MEIRTLKLYDDKTLLNPRRVRVFLAEKGIEVSCIPISLSAGENRTPEFLAKNPLGQIPTLEFEDGSVLTESVSICRYFEEKYPEPVLIGSNAFEKAHVDMWSRRVEYNVLIPAGLHLAETGSGVTPDDQISEMGKMTKGMAETGLRFLDSQLAKSQFIAGDEYTLADISGMCILDFANSTGIDRPSECRSLARWYDEVAARPSAKA